LVYLKTAATALYAGAKVSLSWQESGHELTSKEVKKAK
jgi:hypothetical protein